VLAGKTDAELVGLGYAGQLLLHGRHMSILRALLPVPARKMPRRIVVLGEPGCGKTRMIKDRFPLKDTFWMSNSKWWDGYTNQDVIVLDEFRGWLPREIWLRLYDSTPLRGEIKGGGVMLIPGVVVTISNYWPDQWWKNMKPQWKAITRRIDELIVWDPVIEEFCRWEREEDTGGAGPWDEYALEVTYEPHFRGEIDEPRMDPVL